MGRGTHSATLELLEQAYTVLEEEHPASVRAVCYRLFVAGHIDSMEKKNTQKVSRALVYGRENGLIPWEWIVDDTRSVERAPAFRDKEHFAAAVKNSFRRDFWEHQKCRVELWPEKNTVKGMLKPVLDEYAVGFQVLHGFGSATAVKLSADSSTRDTRPLLVFYVGDWDCSGLHMSELDLPARIERYGGEIEFKRIALTGEDLCNLPYFPASDKKKDPRYRWFVRQYGDLCWELDALPPNLLREKVESAIKEKIEWDSWERCVVAENAEQESLAMVMNNWEAMYEQVGR